MILLSFVEIKVCLTGLSKFKEGVSKIQELLSLRKGINLHLQEIKMDLSRGNEKSEKAIGVFVSGSETNQLGWIQWETISEVERMARAGPNGRLRDKSYNFQGERNFISV